MLDSDIGLRDHHFFDFSFLFPLLFSSPVRCENILFRHSTHGERASEHSLGLAIYTHATQAFWFCFFFFFGFWAGRVFGYRMGSILALGKKWGWARMGGEF